MLRKRLLDAILVVASLLVTYVGLEAAYRVYRYRKLVRGESGVGFFVQDKPLYALDSATGFRYVPNLRLRQGLYGGDGRLLHANSIRTNAQGQIAATDAVPVPDGDAWTIAVLGDSFTAGTTNNTPWPGLLEAELQADTALLRQVGRRTVRVVNLGLDGTGFEQWPSQFKKLARPYAPDVVIVDFISDDIQRRFVWRDLIRPQESAGGYSILLICHSLPVSLNNEGCAFGRMVSVDSGVAVTPEFLKRIRQEVSVEQARRLNWFTLNPELLARILNHRFGLESRLVRGSANPEFESRDAALTASAEALRSITAADSNVLLLYQPGWPEVLGNVRRDIVSELARRIGTEIVCMQSRLPAADSVARATWFGLPYDSHYSDAGNAVYASAVHDLLRVRARHADSEAGARLALSAANEAADARSTDLIATSCISR